MIERPIPLLWKIGSRTRILAPNMSAKDKMLALLYGASGSMKVREVLDAIEYQNASQFRKTIAAPAHKLGLIDFNEKTGELVISPIGQRYVEANVSLTL